MSRRSRVYHYGQGFAEKNEHRVGQLLLTGAVTLGIIDDISVVGIADNNLVGIGSAVLAGLALRTNPNSSDSGGRKALKSILALGVTGMMFDDNTIVGVVDNPIAAVCATSLVVMNFNDWRRNR